MALGNLRGPVQEADHRGALLLTRSVGVKPRESLPPPGNLAASWGTREIGVATLEACAIPANPTCPFQSRPATALRVTRLWRRTASP